MLEDGLMMTDGVAIARLVRDLAHRARMAMQRPLGDSEAHDLLESIEGLERQIEPGSGDELARWLVSLRRRVESLVPATV